MSTPQALFRVVPDGVYGAARAVYHWPAGVGSSSFFCRLCETATARTSATSATPASTAARSPTLVLNPGASSDAYEIAEAVPDEAVEVDRQQPVRPGEVAEVHEEERALLV